MVKAGVTPAPEQCQQISANFRHLYCKKGRHTKGKPTKSSYLGPARDILVEVRPVAAQNQQIANTAHVAMQTVANLQARQNAQLPFDDRLRDVYEQCSQCSLANGCQLVVLSNGTPKSMLFC